MQSTVPAWTTREAARDDRRTVIGGLTLLDTDDRREAERFAADDPYARAGIRAETSIVAWRRRWWVGTFLGEE